MFKNMMVVLFLAVTTLFAATDGAKKNTKMMVSDLMIVPFPGGKMFKTGKIKLSDDQKVKFATEVRPIMHEKYNPLVQEIFMLEKSIQRSIVKKEKELDASLKEKIAKLSTMKQESMEYKVEALLKIKSILTPEQWQVWIKN